MLPKLYRIASVCLLLLTLGLLIPLGVPLDTQVASADGGLQPTDSALLTALAKQGVNVSNVRLYEDATIAHPYSEIYVSQKDKLAFQVFSQLPQVNAEGITIQPQWIDNGDGSFSIAANTFDAQASATQVTLTCINDQPWGALSGQTLDWNPQVFVGDVDYAPIDSNPTLLITDPINGNYQRNTLQWDYGICTRQLRLIEGSIIESWVFADNPGDTVRIVHNQQGFYGLTLGAGADEVTTQDAVAMDLPQVMTIRQQTAIQQLELGGKLDGGGKLEPLPIEPQPQPIEQDVEVFYAESFDAAIYPLTIGGSATFYPNAHPETVSCDGYVRDLYGSGSGVLWATIRGAAGEGASDFNAIDSLYITSDSNSNKWKQLRRMIFTFDTGSVLPDDAIIVSADFYVRGAYKNDNLGITPDIALYSAAPASNSGLAAGDYDSLGSTLFSDTVISYSGFSTTGYNTFSLNAAGLAAISKTGITRLGIRNRNYDVLNVSPAWSWDYYSYLGFYMAEQGAGYMPTLVVTYAGIDLTTLDATLIDSTSATLNGEVVSAPAGNLTHRGFVFDTVSHPVDPGDVLPHASGYTFHDLVDAGNFGNGTYSNSTVTQGSLVHGTTYYFRAVGNNTLGWVYGDQLSFTTLADPPTVITKDATGVNIASAQLNGQITDLGGAASCDYYKFEWGFSTGVYDFSYTSTSGSYGLATYSYSGASLLPNVTYYYVFEAHNTGGWGYGAEKSFVTLPPSGVGTSPAGSLNIEVAGNCSTVYTYLPLYTTLVNTYGLVTQGYVNVSSTNTDLEELNGATLPYLPVTDRLAFLLTNVATYQSETLVYSMGTVLPQTGFPIIVGYNGNLTRADTDAMEPGNNFIFDVAGYLDMGVGNSSPWYRYIFYKQNAIALYVSGVGNLTASIGTDSAPTQSVTITGITTGYHRIQVVGNATKNEFSIYMDSSATFSGNTTIATVGNNTNSWYFMGNNTMPAMTYFKEYTGVPSTLQVQYQPTAYLSGNTTVSDSAHGYSATIAWGTNPSCVTFTTTGEIVSGLAASGGEGNESWIPTFNLIGWYDPELGDLPFYETFNNAAIQMGMPTHSLYLLVMMGTCVAVGLGVLVFTGSSMLSIIAVGATMLAAADTGVVSVWFVLVFALVSISILYLSRQT